MWLDVASSPHSAASQAPFELGCLEVTQVLFEVPSLHAVITPLPFRSW